MNNFIKIAIGCDHAGFVYKEKIKAYLLDNGYEVKDFGTDSEQSVDYPDYVHPLAGAIEKVKYDCGILICGSGNGVAITANKHQYIRAALCWNDEITSLARKHNNANVICLPARFVSIEEAIRMVDIFLHTAFEEGRHEKRVKKIQYC